MMKMSPCKNCPKRMQTCHTSCPEYTQWADEKREVLRKMRETKKDLYTPSVSVCKIYWRNKKKDRK